MNQKHTDILIIGMGLAGITAAITAAESGKKVTIITKTKEFSSGNTPWAQGGIVYKGLKDSPEKLKADSALIVNDKFDENLFLSSRNIKNMEYSDVSSINPVSLMKYEKVIIMWSHSR